MFRYIRTAQTGVKTTFGRFSRTVGPGLRIYIPVVQSIHPVSNRISQSSFRFQVKTQDDVFTELGVAIQHQVEPENTEKFFYKLDDPDSQLLAHVENVIRADVANIPLDRLYKEQDYLSQRIKDELDEKMEGYGLNIISTLITHIEPDEQVMVQMNRIQAAQRAKQAAEYEAAADKIRTVAQAEADRDRKRLQGEGLAQMRKAIVDGYRESVLEMSVALNMSPSEIADFVLMTQRLDTMERIGTSNNAKVLFMDGKETLKRDLLQAKEA